MKRRVKKMKEKKIEGMAGSDDERQCTKSLPLTVELVSESGEKNYGTRRHFN